jgi:hypothetical protein
MFDGFKIFLENEALLKYNLAFVKKKNNMWKN